MPSSRKDLTGSLAAQKYILNISSHISLALSVACMEIMSSQNPSFSSPPFPPSTLPFFQTLSKLLDEDLEHPLVSEEGDHEQDELIPAGVFDTELQWLQNPGEQPESLSMIRRFFSDLLTLSRRYQGRRKKGLSRGCFGVRLDRIGSLSGLGC